MGQSLFPSLEGAKISAQPSTLDEIKNKLLDLFYSAKNNVSSAVNNNFVSSPNSSRIVTPDDIRTQAQIDQDNSKNLGNLILSTGTGRTATERNALIAKANANKPIVDKVVEYLTHLVPTMDELSSGKFSPTKNEDKLHQMLGNFTYEDAKAGLDPEWMKANNYGNVKNTKISTGYYDEGNGSEYIRAIDNMLEHSRDPRRVALGLPREAITYFDKNHEVAKKMLELMDSTAKNPKTTINSPLFRLSLQKELPKNVGEEFYSPFLSFSANPEFKSGDSTVFSGNPTILLPGARTLRLGALSPHLKPTPEAEHLVGGRFKLVNKFELPNGKTIAQVQQIDPKVISLSDARFTDFSNVPAAHEASIFDRMRAHSDELLKKFWPDANVGEATISKVPTSISIYDNPIFNELNDKVNETYKEWVYADEPSIENEKAFMKAKEDYEAFKSSSGIATSHFPPDYIKTDYDYLKKKHGGKP